MENLKHSQTKRIKITLLIIPVFMTGFITHATAQTVILERQVVGSTGFDMEWGGTIYQYTVGEAAILTLMENSSILTQGFQQPEITGLSVTPQIPYVSEFIIYPNPASEYVKLKFNMFEAGNVTIRLVNNAGQIVYTGTLAALAGQLEYTLPLLNYASGLYYVVLSVDSSRKYTEKLIIQ